MFTAIFVTRLVMDYLTEVKTKYPKHFKEKKVLELGSLNMNGTARDFFEDCEYIGLDRREGPDVDVVCNAHEYKGEKVDVVISTEMLEHDKYAIKSIKNGLAHLNKGGIFIGTAANVNREPHCEENGEDNYYKNIDSKMILDIDSKAIIEEDDDKQDIRFIILK